MAKIEVFTCDVCGKQKGASNHWWRGSVGFPYLSVRPWGWSQLEREDAVVNDVHLCGEACATRKLAEVMVGGKQDGEGA